MVDTQTGEVARIVGLVEGSFPRDILWAEGRLYLTLSSSQVQPNKNATAGKAPSNQVIVLDANTLQVVSRIVVPARPETLAWSPQGKMYVGHFDYPSGGISVVDTQTGKVLKELELPLALAGGPPYLRRVPFGEEDPLVMITENYLYVPAGGAIVDTKTDVLITQIKEGDLLRGIAGPLK
jgi:DNA-binding beta-propeller fold protein YncE